MNETWSIISLVLLIVAIVLGFWRKINMGVIAMAFALILGRAAGIKDSAILATFSSSLFLRLLGVMLLFSVAQTNGTVEKLTRSLAALSGNAVKTIPIAIFLLFFALSAVGAGGPAALALVALITVPIAYQLGISPLKLAPAGAFGGVCGMTSLNIVGILAKDLSASAGIEIDLVNFTVTTAVAMTIVFIVWYIASGWLKMGAGKQVEHEKGEPMGYAEYCTIFGIVLLIVLTLVFQVDIGLAGFAVACLLMLIPGVADERKAISAVPWNALVMIGGMGILISMISQLGGIDLLSNFLSSIMTERTAPALMSVIGSLMSAVSSTTGVVMPTLIPTIPGILEAVGGGSAQELVYAVTLGASQTAISPLSTGGALILAAYANVYRPTTEERSKIFVELFIYAIVMALVFALFGLSGYYGMMLNLI